MPDANADVHICTLIEPHVNDTYCGIEHFSERDAQKCRVRKDGEVWDTYEVHPGFYRRRWAKS